MYYFDGPIFENSLFDTFYQYLPTTEPLLVSRTFITKEGNEKTLNLSMKYSSDSEHMYLHFKNNDKPESSTKKILAMIYADEENLIIDETDIDGFLADIFQGMNQQITISNPTDGSKWYITKNQDVFYSWDKSRAYAIPITEEQRVISSNFYEYYFFKAK